MAITSVGRVRIRFNRKRHRATTMPLRLMLVEETTAKGRASVAPSTEPRMDILMVSTSGPITLGRKLQSGWKICFRITVN